MITKAKNNFEKIILSCLITLSLAKQQKKMRKRINIKLTPSEDIFTKHAAKVNFLSGKTFNENSFVINRIKEQLVLNRPIYVGMAILNLSKLLMYDFHHNYILNKYDRKNIRLMFTDTDSLFYEIKTEDAYKDLHEKKRIKNILILPIIQKIANIILKKIKR